MANGPKDDLKDVLTGELIERHEKALEVCRDVAAYGECHCNRPEDIKCVYCLACEVVKDLPTP